MPCEQVRCPSRAERAACISALLGPPLGARGFLRSIYCAIFLRKNTSTGKMYFLREITCNNKCERRPTPGMTPDTVTGRGVWLILFKLVQITCGNAAQILNELFSAERGTEGIGPPSRRARAAGSVPPRDRRHGTATATGPPPAQCVEQVPHPCRVGGYLLESTGYAKEREGASHVRQRSAE